MLAGYTGLALVPLICHAGR